MRKVTSFNDYLFDKIFEAVESKETLVYLSPRLRELIGNIDHPIADDLYDFGRNTVMNDKVTLLDYDDNDVSKFTYTVPSKLIDLVEKDDEISNYYVGKLDNREAVKDLTEEYPVVWTKFRNPSSIGKVINKLFPSKYKPNGAPGEDIESFTNEVKAERTKGEEAFKRFKIVDGDDIIHFYNYESYDKSAFGGSNLGSSCMRYGSCEDYIEFYAKNPGTKLVILMSENNEDKIVGRAVLWDISYIDGDKIERKFMDRIYYVTDTDMRLFKEFAKKNGWLHKENQNMYSDTKIVDTKDGSVQYKNLQTVDTFKETGYYPYMDTMKYFHIDGGYLTNNEDDYGDSDVYFLESTSGDYEGRSGIYVDYYGERIDEDDLVWCELGDDWRYPDDAVYIEREGEYATQRYADDHFTWSDYEDDYIDNDDSVWSKYHDSEIVESDSVEVYEAGASDTENIDEVEESDLDPRSQSEIGSSIIEYQSRDGNEYFFDDADEDNFVEVTSLRRQYQVMAHKVWDADRIFTHNGNKYLDDAGSEKKDKLIGQKRIEF
jgi:hypothetical protein